MKHHPQITDYIKALKEYNETTNIYSKNAYDKLDFHIEDCRHLSSLIGDDKATVLDIGSGSGLPSIPLAILNKNHHILAVESKNRKTIFLRKVKKDLNLSNIDIITSDINEFISKRKPRVDIITAKAFGSLEKVIKIVKPIQNKNTKIILPISKKQKEDYEKIYPKVKFTKRKDCFFYLITNLKT